MAAIDFAWAVRATLTMVDARAAITPDALDAVSAVLVAVLEQISCAVPTMQEVVTEDDVKVGAKGMLARDLALHAESSMDRALRRVGPVVVDLADLDAQHAAAVCAGTSCTLIFPLVPLRAWYNTRGLSITADACVALAALLEYLCAEILETSSKLLDHVITRVGVARAMEGDASLARLLQPAKKRANTDWLSDVVDNTRRRL